MAAFVEIATLVQQLSHRAHDSHKGDFGRALIIGGSRGMSGAVALAGKAALRSGAGLVTLAVPLECLPTVAAIEPSYMTLGLLADGYGRLSDAGWATLEPQLDAYTAIACGPGLGRGDGIGQLVAKLYVNCPRPMVLDADALNALAALDGGMPNRAADAPRILTPHPGEFARLIGRRIDGRAEQQKAAEVFAAEHDLIVVLKGAGTIITDGKQTAINATGNPGMATGGSGDVLTGIVTALLCQGLSPFDAARVGAHVHGRAGDVAVAEFGQISLIASDLVAYLPAAFRSCAVA